MINPSLIIQLTSLKFSTNFDQKYPAGYFMVKNYPCYGNMGSKIIPAAVVPEKGDIGESSPQGRPRVIVPLCPLFRGICIPSVCCRCIEAEGWNMFHHGESWLHNEITSMGERNIANDIRIDFEGQKIHVPEGYSTDKLGVTDVLAMWMDVAKETSVWQYGEKLIKNVQSNPYFDRLHNGEPAVVGVAVVSLVAGMVIAYGLINCITSGKDDSSKEKKESEKEEPEDPPRDFTVEQLREYDGTEDKPIYVSLCREVFDVSDAADFYGVGQGYHCFAGRESTRAMAKLSFEEEDLSSLKNDDFGPFEKDTLDGWYQKFKYYKNYPVRGRVSVPPSMRDFTRAELAQFKGHQDPPEGRVNAPIYMALKGQVLDVSYGGVEMYAEGGPYYRFAGKDASRALAKMSFEPADIDSSDLSDLTPEQQKTLNDWEQKFLHSKKYPIVGKLID